jgi:hypothetical protein
MKKSANLLGTANLVNFNVPGSGSAFPIRIWIQDSQINADPDPQQKNTRKIVPDPDSEYGENGRV